jgi:NADH:ubiquinone oxidoreductase subunit K
MTSIGHYLFLSVALFLIGVIGVFMRRNIIAVLMSIELILNGALINLAAFSRMFGDTAGQVFALFILVVVAAEAVVALAIVFALFRNRQTLSTRDMDLLRW